MLRSYAVCLSNDSNVLCVQVSESWSATEPAKGTVTTHVSELGDHEDPRVGLGYEKLYFKETMSVRFDRARRFVKLIGNLRPVGDVKG